MNKTKKKSLRKNLSLKTKGKLKKISPKKSHELFVTHGLLKEVKGELKSEITSLRLEMRSGFKMVDAKLLDVLSVVKKVASDVHAMRAEVEEQNSRNRYVLDGYTSLNDRLEIVEKSIKSAD